MTKIALLIPAAGRSERFGGQNNKLLLPIAGKTVLQRTLHAFEKIERIAEVVLIYSGATHEAVQQETEYGGYAFEQILTVPGGARRQDSVLNGLAAVGEDCTTVMIHDAARPFIQRETIEAALEACDQSGAAIVGIPAQDTIKKVRAGNLVEATLDRSVLWQTQTPQVFRKEVLLAAFRHAEENDIESNDEAELVERTGHSVVMVTGSARNIKITTPEDLPIAEAIAAGL